MRPGRTARAPSSSPARRHDRQQGCELIGLSRSTFFDAPSIAASQDRVVKRISTICDECECYGYRRVGAALCHQGVAVNGKKIRRLMREHALQPKGRRRYVVTTDSNHDRLSNVPISWGSRI